MKRLVLVAAGASIVLGASALVFDHLARGTVPSGGGTAVTLDQDQDQDQKTDPALPGKNGGDDEPAINGEESAEASKPEETGADSGTDRGSGDGAEPADDTTKLTEAGDQTVLEVLPPVEAPPTGLPMPSPPPALVSAPLPEAASAVGDIVGGFPSHFLSFPDTTTVLFTGVSSSGDTLQATADGIATLSLEEVAGHFQQVLLTAGFQSGEASTAPAGQHALRLTRGLDSVSISIYVTESGSTRFSLLGNFHTQPGA